MGHSAPEGPRENSFPCFPKAIFSADLSAGLRCLNPSQSSLLPFFVPLLPLHTLWLHGPTRSSTPKLLALSPSAKSLSQVR